MTLGEFRGLYPEFYNAPDTMIAAYLASTLREVDPLVFEATASQAHGLLTAHRLALSPFGKNSRMASDKGETTYGKQFKELQVAAACGLRVWL